MALPERPEPMNAITNHSKVKVSIAVSDPTFVAGKYVSGKMEMECRADKGLGIGVIMVELFGFQELSSRDHSATSTFLHAQRLFQGPGLPPSNAVQAHSEPGDPPLPAHHYHARRGISTFLFRIPLPVTSPSSVNFGGGLAMVKYELRASASVFWRGDKQLVTERKPLDVVEGLDDMALAEYVNGNDATSIAVGENGKLWMQGNIVGGGIITAGESACVEFQVKNHSTKKNTGLTLTLTRRLVLPNIPATEKQPLQITDTLSNVAFRGAEYIIQPGVEGVANLVFDVPKTARGVKGGTYEDEGDERPRVTQSIFEVQCFVSIKMNMGIGNKDLVLDIPVTIVSPLAIPHELLIEKIPQTTGPIEPASYSVPPDVRPYSPYPMASPPPAMSPQLPPMIAVPYADHNQVWLPPPSQSPFPYQLNPYYSPVTPPPLQIFQNLPPPRPSSALASYSEPSIPGLPPTAAQHPLLPLNLAAHYEALQQAEHADYEPEEGKGERASRVTQRLHLSSRHRSVSPRSHRFPLPRTSPGRPTATTETETSIRVRPLPTVPPIFPSPHHEGDHSLEPAGPLSVHSPRPILSPKVSHASLRSQRVEELERLAAAADEDDVVVEEFSTARKRRKRRKGKEKEVADADMNKTLPAPPVPTRKGFLSPPGDLSVYGEDPPGPPSPPSPAPADKAPPTPTLTAITPVRHARSNLTERLAAERAESGLDALERRLLAEVGTKKVERMFSQPPPARTMFSGPSNANGPEVVVSVMPGGHSGALPAKGRLSPIKIPAPRVGNADEDGLNIDSAISSLTLADGGWAMGADRREREGHEDRELDLRPRNNVEDLEVDGDSDERTHRAGTVGRQSKSSLSGEDGQEENKQSRRHRRQAAGLLAGGELEMDDGADSRGRSKEESGKGKRGGKKKEGHKRRKSAKGRVAAWLGTIDPEALPPEDGHVGVSYSESGVLAQLSLESDHGSKQVLRPEPEALTKHVDLASVPAEDKSDVERAQADVPTTPPNPRSSGFMPIGTQKRETTRMHLKVPPIGNLHQETLSTRNADVKPVTQNPEAKPTVIAKQIQLPSSKSQNFTPPVDRNHKPHSGPKNNAVKDEPVKVAAAVQSDPQPKKSNAQQIGLRPPLLLPPRARSQDPEVKYDVRSARGGRGGHVTAIAAFWASAAATDGPKGGVPDLTKSPSIGPSSRKHSIPAADTRLTSAQRAHKPIPSPPTQKPPADVKIAKAQRVNKPTLSPSIQPQPALKARLPFLREAKAPPSVSSTESSPKLLALAGKASGVTKSPSVPAIVSSSLATPMLSTTASLARSHAQQPTRPTLAPVSTASAAEITSRSHGPSRAKSTPDLGFGKARLRDLIKKYQEQAS